MSYPQPVASREVLDGQDFFRLYTWLESGADAYEIDVSAKAFVIGPQSDLGAVRVTYFDESQPARSSSFVVSVGDPFLGRVDALASKRFQVSDAPARIIVTPEDLYNDRWFPTVDALDNVSFIRPRLDLLTYFSEPAAVPSKRADFVERGRLTINDRGAGTGITWLVVPFWKRRFASIQVRNTNVGAVGYTVDVVGINFTTDGVPPYLTPSDFIVAETPIVTAGAVAAGAAAVTDFEVRASTDGLFDYLLISFAGNAIDGSLADAIRYTVKTTDEET